MMCYAGIDLHATNSVVVVIDDTDRVLYQKRLPNDLPLILATLDPLSGDRARRGCGIHL